MGSVWSVQEAGTRRRGAVLMELFGSTAMQRERVCLHGWRAPSSLLPGAAKIGVWLSSTQCFWNYSRMGFVASLPDWF